MHKHPALTRTLFLIEFIIIILSITLIFYTLNTCFTDGITKRIETKTDMLNACSKTANFWINLTIALTLLTLSSYFLFKNLTHHT